MYFHQIKLHKAQKLIYARLIEFEVVIKREKVVLRYFNNRPLLNLKISFLRIQKKVNLSRFFLPFHTN
jgi:hypothetical protein